VFENPRDYDFRSLLAAKLLSQLFSQPLGLSVSCLRSDGRGLFHERFFERYRCVNMRGAGEEDSWLLWLDLWAQSPRNPAVAAIRQKIDERWRETIRTQVLTGQEAGEFAAVDADDFTAMLSVPLYGFVVPIALDDPVTGPRQAFELSMQFASGRLGFRWNGPRSQLGRR
jgi:hypothetical protein